MANPNLGVMMTLAQLAALSPNPRPSGETRQKQAQRILAGINSMLQNSNLNLPTGTSWHAQWVGLTVDGGNLCYIAASPTQNAFAVCCRGTQFNSLVDLGEDLDVGNVCQFLPPGATSPLVVSQGAMKAFTDATNATGVLNGAPDLKLLGALEQLVSDSGSNSAPTIYVTGHSLGGAMATMIALYLKGQAWPQPTPLFQVYTFAAPTAGIESFATYYDQVFTSEGNSFRTYNQWDAVPYAWANLNNVETNFYPAPSDSSPSNPGPYQGEAISIILSDLANLPSGNVYWQTNGNEPTGPNTIILESAYVPGPPPPSSPSVQPTLAGFMGQIAYQHNCYLQLITGQVGIWPPAGKPSGLPQVTGISPNNGPIAGGVQVTITGGVFTSDCVVDFGSVPATIVTISPGQIIAIQPPGTGTVDVRVTNMYGTSAVTLAGQFTAPRPLAPTISSVTAIASGLPSNQVYVVQILGTGFVIPSQENTVNFGGTAGSNVQVLSLGEILVTPPAQGGGPASVNVQVTNDLGTSQSSQFMLGTPVVTGVTASSGPAKNGNQITISGFGFQQNCTVTFVSASPIIKSLKNVSTTWKSDNSIVVTPPNVVILAGAYNVVYNIQVTNPGGQTSPITPADLFMYYPGNGGSN